MLTNPWPSFALDAATSRPMVWPLDETDPTMWTELAVFVAAIESTTSCLALGAAAATAGLRTKGAPAARATAMTAVLVHRCMQMSFRDRRSVGPTTPIRQTMWSARERPGDPSAGVRWGPVPRDDAPADCRRTASATGRVLGEGGRPRPVVDLVVAPPALGVRRGGVTELLALGHRLSHRRLQVADARLLPPVGRGAPPDRLFEVPAAHAGRDERVGGGRRG